MALRPVRAAHCIDADVIISVASARVVPLLAAALFISYFDRGIVSTTAPLIQSEFALSNRDMGVIFSAFFWSYAPLQPVAGWLAQRFDVRHVLGLGVAIWALATLSTGLTSTVAQILVLRLMLGFGESVVYPCNAKFLAQRAAATERGRANGLIAVGQSLGPTCGTIASGLIMSRYGWRAAFLLFGLLSLVWLVPWLRATRGGLTSRDARDRSPVRYARLLAERALWGTSLGHFCSNYAYYFMLTWLPLVLVKRYGFGLDHMALIGGAVYAVQAVSAALCGWLCDRLILRGSDLTLVLKSAMIAGLLGVALAMAVCAIAGPVLSVTMMLLAGFAIGIQSAPMNSMTQTLGGPRAAGQWMGVQNLCANMAGVLGPPLTGLVVDRTGNYTAAFLIAAAVTLAGILAYAVVIRRIEPVNWPSSALGSFACTS